MASQAHRVRHPQHATARAKRLQAPILIGLVCLLRLRSSSAWAGGALDPEDSPFDSSGEPGGKADGPGCAEAVGGDHFEFLDGVCGREAYPSDLDRYWTCSNIATTSTPLLSSGDTVVYRTREEPIEVDQDGLVGVVPEDLDVAVILVRRVDGVPHLSRRPLSPSS